MVRNFSRFSGFLCLSNRPGNFEKPRGEGRDKFVLSETGRPVIDRSGDKIVGHRLVDLVGFEISHGIASSGRRP